MRTPPSPRSRGSEATFLRTILVLGTGLLMSGPDAAPLAAQVSPAPPPVEHQDLLREQLEQRVEDRLHQVDGVVGVWVKDLTDGYIFGVNADGLFPTASAIKIAILAELYRQVEAGGSRLDDPVRLTASDRTGGSGILQHLGDGTAELSVRDLAVFMIQMSDNTATNLIIDRVGMDAVNALLDQLGLPATRLRRKMIRPDDQAAGRENVSTPGELGRLVEMLHAGELASNQGTVDMLAILSIPKGGTIPGALPVGVRAAHKTGSLSGVLVDAGVVLLEGRPYVISVMGTFLAPGGGGAAALSDVVSMVHDHMVRLERANAFGAVLPRGTSRRH